MPRYTSRDVQWQARVARVALNVAKPETRSGKTQYFFGGNGGDGRPSGSYLYVAFSPTEAMVWLSGYMAGRFCASHEEAGAAE